MENSIRKVVFQIQSNNNKQKSRAISIYGHKEKLCKDLIGNVKDISINHNPINQEKYKCKKIFKIIEEE